VHVDGLEVVEKETQPPRPFDDATLLNAMKHAGRDIDDDALAAAMKTSGLGTPATRAEIIEKLLRTGYIERQRKQLRATDKGKALIGMVAEPLRSVETTAAWEQRLKDVEQGSADAAAFYRDICTLIGELIPQVAQGPAMSAEQVAAAKAASPGRGPVGAGAGKRRGAGRQPGAAQPSDLGTCPICKQGEIVETAKAFGCSRWRDGCGFTIWKTMSGKRLAKAEVKRLIEQGHTDPIEGFKSKAGKPFSAVCGWTRPARWASTSSAPGRRQAATATPAPKPGSNGQSTAARGDCYRTRHQTRRLRAERRAASERPGPARPSAAMPQVPPGPTHRRPSSLRLQPLARRLRLRRPQAA
jgi:DNA topoisomerase-3